MSDLSNSQHAPLRRALEELAGTSTLLVAADYDGTLAPIVDDPDKAFPNPESIKQVVHLSQMPNTKAAVISGRALAVLAKLAQLPAQVQLVGSHGSEFAGGLSSPVDDDAKALLAKVTAELRRIAAEHPGAHVETKPVSAALHVRRVPSAADGEKALAEVRDGAQTWPGVYPMAGKAVIELAVIPTDKGSALDLLRTQDHATGVLYVGDDVTDEKAFARVSSPDVSVKVGGGATAALFRVDDTDDVAEMLTLLADLREKEGNPAT